MNENQKINDKPFEVSLYLKIFGLAVDSNGEKCYAYVQIGYGNSKIEVPYDKVVQLVDLSKVANSFKCDSDHIIVITKEEYEKKGGLD